MATTTSTQYVGRFAPSPSGPLHFGSLVTALASWLDARAHQGKWLLRIEDLDPPRESAAAPDIIQRQLEAFGLNWDDTPLFQSTRLEAYERVLNQLASENHLFQCTCSRKAVRGVYPGTCRAQKTNTGTTTSHAVRFRVPAQIQTFIDRISGNHRFDLSTEIGDFIVRRRDGRTAYQLAVVVDDAYQGITDIVRGNDLLDSTPRQQSLIDALGFNSIRYAHLPVVLGADSKKLSKQAHATPLDTIDPQKLLLSALRCLGQTPISRADDVESLLKQATSNWCIASIPLESTIWTS